MAKGGFFLFMRDLKEREEAAGHRVAGGLNCGGELFRLASKEWSCVSQSEKLAYKEKSKVYKNSPQYYEQKLQKQKRKIPKDRPPIPQTDFPNPEPIQDEDSFNPEQCGDYVIVFVHQFARHFFLELLVCLVWLGERRGTKEIRFAEINGSFTIEFGHR